MSAGHIFYAPTSTNSSLDVSLRSRIGGLIEDRASGSCLDELADSIIIHQKHCREISNASGLKHLVRDEHDCDFGSQFSHLGKAGRRVGELEYDDGKLRHLIASEICPHRLKSRAVREIVD
jgi:hypothetical protein